MRATSLVFAGVFGLVLAGVAQAQDVSQLEQRLTILENRVEGLLAGGGTGGGAEGEVAVRLDQIENRLRTLTGQVEALQFEMQRLRQQQGAAPAAPGAGAGTQQGFNATQDRFQPGSDARSLAQDPGALGNQAQALGGTGAPAGSAPQGEESLAPLDLSGLGGISGFGGPGAQSQGQAGGGQQAALAPPDSPQEAFAMSQEHIEAGEYDLAEAGFRNFISSYPEHQLVPEARYWIGESQLRRQQYRQAAESFLTIYEEHQDSALVPDSLYKLGLSLRGLGANEDACGAFAEALNHPRVTPETRQRIEAGMQELQCG